ncbi:(E)-4-hydroxy-3-methylbut-2-enyl-diphosphate synthase [Neochlamydia sp. AcF95]|uniref:(E)-4-hydroxy-3-methylbut-2-enyl-diphosphate synthase n=1 Tax=Neochlamydia sp. AcF95 TaxID=2795734 RepID=UPI001BCA2CD3|nr:(E)-4-hydroxy-3-methylbut-2-enyl-diphosphate synthase [Neochlamydia sp. AcF95]MBS4170300.1 4-hydroxy-3-methylbut-2-en-1-yl diphosphate synthase (flavodoxin) [Neochlamydia sp. AcF95]
MKYCESIAQLKRRSTREVMVGPVGVGGNNPIRIQSMTTSNTRDAEATIQQIMRLADAGCEIARVTVQGMKEADSCEAIKNGLLQKGYSIPLVADIHFFPPAAMRVIDFVDKVRINPGNFVDKRASFKVIDYDDYSYAQEILKIEEKFTPLVEKCKSLKRAMRIGTNHGSLSDRIMNRYGDTPAGMVESALEFARICRKNDYHDVIFSMKSSNPQVMILAYRLLVAEMYKLGWDYPLHLGVTEAGEGEDGRIKSAMGIGSLLLDGIGDTIRVSLTEDPWHEIDPCRRLIKFTQEYSQQNELIFEERCRDFQNIERRAITYPKSIGMHKDGTVWVSAPKNNQEDALFYQHLGCEVQLGRPQPKISSVDGLVIPDGQFYKQVLPTLQEIGMSIFSSHAQEGVVPLLNLIEARQYVNQHKFLLSSQASWALAISDESPDEWEAIPSLQPSLIIFRPSSSRVFKARRFFDWLKQNQIGIPVILNFHYNGSQEDLVIQSSMEYGALFCDGLGEGIWLEAPYEINYLRHLSFSILQAARMRMVKTDFISCPSCGRTLFDLQEVTKRIRERTSHLPGVKIAIMGCIVNGPGEMADADFGYVGSKAGMIDLYVGKECVQKNIPFAEADDKLVELLKSYGRWQEPCLA